MGLFTLSDIYFGPSWLEVSAGKIYSARPQGADGRK